MSADEGPSIVVDRPVHEVFAFVTDLRNARLWAPEMGELDMTGPMAEGATFREQRRVLGLRRTADWVVTKLVPDRVVELAFRFGPMRGDFGYRFEPAGDGTKVSQTVHVRLAGPLAILNGMLAREVVKEEGRELERLKQELEGRRASG